MLNIKQFDLEGLSTLWLVSIRNPELRKNIENELQIKIANNQNFSREYLYKINKVQSHALGVFFIPSSSAHKLYGDYVTVDLSLSKEEMLELITNYTSQPPKNTFGQIKAKVEIDDIMTEEQIINLQTIGFHTRDILKVQFV